MRPDRLALMCLGAVLAVCLAPAATQAQGRASSIPVFSMNPPAAEEPEGPANTMSGVSSIDAALPRTMLRTRFDFAYNNPRPTRAEYFQPKGGLPWSPGPDLPERRVDHQEWNTYVEYAFGPWLSAFLETPYRWINPDFNRNIRGLSDMNLGFKLIVWQDTDFFATFQLRAYVPTARHGDLGTDHFSIEPALLANIHVNDKLTLEGELRYWTALGGTDFAGDLVRYGLGITYGQRTEKLWITPVAEVVGWSILSGKSLVVQSPASFYIDDAAGDTIIHGQLGVRFGLGTHADIYAGYSRGLTGHYWNRDLFRLEFRWLF